MSWGYIDSTFYDHPKFMALGPVSSPLELWMHGLAWTLRNRRINLAPGHVPRSIPARFACSQARGDRYASQLVEVELWEPAVISDGWTICDWGRYAEPEEPPRHRTDIIKILSRRDGPSCRWCGHTPDNILDLEIDHVIPRARGGEHVMSNLQLLCGTCNRSKGARHPAELWMEIDR